jgi:hypothetical protein
MSDQICETAFHLAEVTDACDPEEQHADAKDVRMPGWANGWLSPPRMHQRKPSITPTMGLSA